MKKWMAAIGLAMVLSQQAGAWRPAGWVYHNYPWAYEPGSGDWYWFHTGSTQWVARMDSGAWARLPDSALATGWAFYNWAFAYAQGNGVWHWINETDHQPVVNMRTGFWSRFGVTTVPEGMVRIPAGAFTMGNAMDAAEGGGDERPLHIVPVSEFFLGRTEVTKAQWDEVYAWAVLNGYGFNNEGQGKATNHPVVMIYWYDAIKWCNARSQMEGLTPCYTVGGLVYTNGQHDPVCDWTANGYRLPTEAEWEKAARGGWTGLRFPWADSLNTISQTRANYTSTLSYAYDQSPTEGHHPVYGHDPMPYTSPVGSFAPNDYGLYDMAGNVAEYCWDWYASDWYGDPDATAADCRGPATGNDQRVCRGGTWGDGPNIARCANRLFSDPANNWLVIGFRVARSGL